MNGEELYFDGIVGPTHNYGGLPFGNLASMGHKEEVSHPRKAALEGLSKMKLVHDLGCTQGFFLPQERPFLPYLRKFGISGKITEILKHAEKEKLLTEASSASSMWAANSATVTPSVDSKDKALHITIANMSTWPHRALEAKATERMIREIFGKVATIHPPLPSEMSDEGSANTIRFTPSHGMKGIHLFVYGKSGKFPGRQSLAASRRVASMHGLGEEETVFAQQSQQAIDAGVFHNDVISMGHLCDFYYHPEAFVDTPEVIQELKEKFRKVADKRLNAHPITISLEEAVSSYFFNSEIVTDRAILIAPTECRGIPERYGWSDVRYTDIHESMKNGGGPACLRLKVVVTPQQKEGLDKRFLLTDALYNKLVEWVKRYYRERLNPSDLADPLFARESYEALDALTELLKIGSFYDFQKEEPCFSKS